MPIGDQIPRGEDEVPRQLAALRQAIDNHLGITPVQFRSQTQTQSGFAITGTIADFAVTSVPVPVGYTSAVVTLSVIGGCQNAGASGWADLRLQSKIQGTAGGPVIQSIPASQYASTSLSQSLTLSGLVQGSSISVAASMSFGGTGANTFASTVVSVIFTL